MNKLQEGKIRIRINDTIDKSIMKSVFIDSFLGNEWFSSEFEIKDSESFEDRIKHIETGVNYIIGKLFVNK